MKRRLAIVVCLLSGLASAGSPSEPPTPVIGISEYKPVPIGHLGIPIMLPLRCSSDGSVLVQPNHNGRTPRHEDPLLLVHADGTVVKITMPDGFDGWWSDYQFGSHGEIYVLTQTVTETETEGWTHDWLLEFAKEGSFVSKTELLPEGIGRDGFAVRHFAWLDRQTLLISGVRVPPEMEHPHSDFFPSATILVNSKGQYLRDAAGVETPDKLMKGVVAPTSTEWVHPQTEKFKQVEAYDISSWLTEIYTTIDGHAYLRPGSSNYVYVLGPDGRVSKQLTLEPPEANMRLLNIAVRDGLLSAWFQGTDDKKGLDARYLLYDLSTGKLWRHFRADIPKLKGLLACHSRTSLTFLGDSQGHMEWDIVPIQ